MSFLLQWVLVFTVLFVGDICWAFYISNVSDGKPFKSALWGTSMFGIGAIGTISYVNNTWLLIPALLGAFAGTYVGVVLRKRKEA